MTTKDKLIRDNLVKKWKRRLGLNDWCIYVIEESEKVMTKQNKNAGNKGDMYPYPDKKVGFIRHITWSKLKEDEKETVLVHELLHFAYPQDSEKIIHIMAEEAIRDYKRFKQINNKIERGC